MREGTTSPVYRYARGSGLAALVALVALLAACSSAAKTSSAPKVSVIASESTEVKAATAFIQPYLIAPTKIPLEVPLVSAPPSGKTIVFLQCELAQCKGIGDGVTTAATVVHWNIKVIPYESTNPSTLAAALDQALQYHPVAVAFTSPPYALWSQKVAEYKNAGVALIPSFTGEVPLDATIIANPSSTEYANRNGAILGNWFIQVSNAAGHVLSVGVPEFPWLAAVANGFKSAVKDGCHACKVTNMDVAIPDLGSGAITTNVVSALQKDPSINYVVADDSAFLLALPAGLSAAGLSNRVTVAGCCGGQATEAGLATGQFHAVTGVNGNYAGFITVDAALRFAERSPIPSNEGDLPVGLLVKGTDEKPSDSYNEPSGYVDQFKALWKVS
jgi:ribose transport system substrate-binding protein